MQNATERRPSPPATSAGGEIIRDPLVYVDEHGQERECAAHQVTNTSRKAAEVLNQLPVFIQNVQNHTKSRLTLRRDPHGRVNTMLLMCSLAPLGHNPLPPPASRAGGGGGGGAAAAGGGEGGSGAEEGGAGGADAALTPRAWVAPAVITETLRAHRCNAHVLAVAKQLGTSGPYRYTTGHRCRRCGVKCASRYELRVHGSECKVEGFECQHCQRMFKTKQGLRSHASLCETAPLWGIVQLSVCDEHTHAIPKLCTARDLRQSSAPVQTYLNTVGGNPTADTRRLAIRTMLAEDPTATATLRQAYSMEACARRAAGLEAGPATTTFQTARFLACLSLRPDIAVVMVGHNKLNQKFCVVKLPNSTSLTFIPNEQYALGFSSTVGNRHGGSGNNSGSSGSGSGSSTGNGTGTDRGGS